MLTTTIVLEGNAATDVRSHRTKQGRSLAEVVVLVNQPTTDHSRGQDAEPSRHRVVAFGTLADNLSVSISKGDRVLVAGRMITDTWVDTATDQKHSTIKVLAYAAGPSLRFTAATPTPPPRSPSAESGQNGDNDA